MPPDRTVTGIAASSPAAPVVAPEALAVEPEPTAAPRPWWRRAPVLVGAGAIVVAAVVAAVAAWPGGGGHTRVQTLTQPSVSQTVAPSTTTSPPVTFAPPALREALLQTPFPITLVPASFVFYGPGTLGDYRGGKLAASPNQHLPPITPDNRFRYVGDAQIYLNRPVPRPQQTAFWTIQYWVFADEAGAQAWEVDSGRFFQIARVGNVEIRITWGTTDNQGYGAEQQNADQAVLFIAAKTFLAQVRATAT